MASISHARERLKNRIQFVICNSIIRNCIIPPMSQVFTCPNCEQVADGMFCSHCGQKTIDHTDRSVRHLVAEFLGNLFFLDNRLFVTFRYFLLFPGKMTVEFLEGKRRKFLPPITLFLFINLIYFFSSPLTDYSLPIHDQVKQLGHGPIAKKMLERRLEEREITLEDYAPKYKKASDDISKTVMILNVPLIALFTYLISFKRRKFYYDSLIFSLHYFSFFLFSILFGDLLHDLLSPLLKAFSLTINGGIWILVFIAILPTIYATFSLKRFLQINWALTPLAAIFVFIGAGFTQFVYRGIIFFLTFWMT